VTSRTIPLVVGVVALLVGGILAVGGVGGGGIAQGMGFLVASLVAGVVAVAALLVRSVEEPAGRPLPNRTNRPGVSQPGDDIDRRLAESGSVATRGETRDRAEAVATDVLARRRGCSRERARELLTTGQWTDDPAAREFFTEGVRRRSLGDRLRTALGGDSTFREQLDAVTAELVRYQRGEQPETGTNERGDR
jgi:hypothetical protein